MRNVIDLHCDTLTECCKRNVGLTDDSLQLSIARIPADIRLCQAMAIFMPDDLRGEAAVNYYNMVYNNYKVQKEQYRTLLQEQLDLCCIPNGLEKNRFTCFLAVEGGSALAGDINRVGELYRMGVRMMTLTWNAENEICGGAATDLGFTAFGRNVVKEMERVGMLVDCSHLSDAGFWELCEIAGRPFLVSHSNLRSVCNHRRNLTDDMFRELARRGGIVGLNYYRGFIREDGEHGAISDLLRHIHRFLELGGENTLALGSDFDGADMPDYIPGVERLGGLLDAIERSGIPAAVVEKIAFRNAERYLRLYGGRLT